METSLKTRLRVASVSIALDGECAGLNEAICQGARVIVKTAFGPYRLTHMRRSDIWGTCIAVDAKGTDCGPGSRGFAFCNDWAWSDMLRQAGVIRHPIFADRA